MPVCQSLRPGIGAVLISATEEIGLSLTSSWLSAASKVIPSSRQAGRPYPRVWQVEMLRGALTASDRTKSAAQCACGWRELYDISRGWKPITITSGIPARNISIAAADGVSDKAFYFNRWLAVPFPREDSTPNTQRPVPETPLAPPVFRRAFRPSHIPYSSEAPAGNCFCAR